MNSEKTFFPSPNQNLYKKGFSLFRCFSIHTNEDIEAHCHQYYIVLVLFYSVCLGFFYTTISLDCGSHTVLHELLYTYKWSFLTLFCEHWLYAGLAQCSVHGQDRRQPNTCVGTFSCVPIFSVLLSVIRIWISLLSWFQSRGIYFTGAEVKIWGIELEFNFKWIFEEN